MRVSVALCAFNGAEYISDQLDSIIGQTHRPDQIVVCDDGSTDETLEIVNEYEREYPGLFDIYENEGNLGVTKNFEKSIRNTDGDVILLSDQDDIWEETKIERQLKVLTENDAILTFHDSRVVSQDLQPLTTLWKSIQYNPGRATDPEDMYYDLMARNFVQGATIAFKNELKSDILPIPSNWQHDYYISLVAAVLDQIHGIDDTLLRYRQHPEQDIGVPSTGLLSRS